VADLGAHQTTVDARQGTAPEPAEALLEEMRIKLSSLVSDLLGVSGRRMLKALADGEKDAARLAALADPACAPPNSNYVTRSTPQPRSTRTTGAF
jgi:transposase